MGDADFVYDTLTRENLNGYFKVFMNGKMDDNSVLDHMNSQLGLYKIFADKIDTVDTSTYDIKPLALIATTSIILDRFVLYNNSPDINYVNKCISMVINDVYRIYNGIRNSRDVAFWICFMCLKAQNVKVLDLIGYGLFGKFFMFRENLNLLDEAFCSFIKNNRDVCINAALHIIPVIYCRFNKMVEGENGINNLLNEDYLEFVTKCQGYKIADEKFIMVCTLFINGAVDSKEDQTIKYLEAMIKKTTDESDALYKYALSYIGSIDQKNTKLKKGCIGIIQKLTKSTMKTELMKKFNLI